jgi:hypothetical protein
MQERLSSWPKFKEEVDSEECEPGAAPAASWGAVEAAFAAYVAHGHDVQLASFYDDYCTAGQACLPCAPGHASDGSGRLRPVWAWVLHAEYRCYKCAAGQNTSKVASTRARECVCVAGHDVFIVQEF